MCIVIPFITLYQVYAIKWMIVKGYEKQSRNIVVISSLIGFIIAYPLINKFSYYGVVCVLIIVDFLLGVLSFMFYKKRKILQ